LYSVVWQPQEQFFPSHCECLSEIHAKDWFNSSLWLSSAIQYHWRRPSNLDCRFRKWRKKIQLRVVRCVLYKRILRE
jgi:hypothetical protein